MAYNGGKGQEGVYQTLINQIPEHLVFIECFLGYGSITRRKRPAATTIGIEADASVLAAHWRGDELPGLQLVCADALAWLSSYDWTGGEFVLADPPYLFETRSGGQTSLYPYEFGEVAQHRALLAVLKRLPCPVMLCGYASPLYADELRGWRTLTYQAVKRSGELATEWLWMNYPEPAALHDYRYLGRNFRERERIKKLKARWARRLNAMPLLQRQALLAALHDVRDPIAAGGEIASGSVYPRHHHQAGRCMEDSAGASPSVAIVAGDYRQDQRGPRPPSPAAVLHPTGTNAIQEPLL